MTKQSGSPTSEQFETALAFRFNAAEERGEQWVDVNAWELHGNVAGYLGANHKMEMCCLVMHATLQDGDEVLSRPRTGRGADLLVRYKIPR
jgi:hypothetical protein